MRIGCGRTRYQSDSPTIAATMILAMIAGARATDRRSLRPETVAGGTRDRAELSSGSVGVSSGPSGLWFAFAIDPASLAF
jgi:hypothetical protein